MSVRLNYRRHSTYEPAESAKTAQWALFAGKMRAKFNQVANGLVVWIQPNNTPLVLGFLEIVQHRMRPKLALAVPALYRLPPDHVVDEPVACILQTALGQQRSRDEDREQQAPANGA